MRNPLRVLSSEWPVGPLRKSWFGGLLFGNDLQCFGNQLYLLTEMSSLKRFVGVATVFGQGRVNMS